MLSILLMTYDVIFYKRPLSIFNQIILNLSRNLQLIEKQIRMMKKSSPVWESFEKVDNKQVKCKLCCENLSFRGGTSSMLSNLRSEHPAVTYTQPRQQQQLNIFGGGAGPRQSKTTQGQKVQPMMASFVTLQRKCNPGRQETITSLITKMVALDMMPVYMAGGKDFEI